MACRRSAVAANFQKKRIQLFAGGGIVQEEDDEWCKYNEPHLCNCRVRALLFPSPCRHRVGFCISSGVDWMEGVPVCLWPRVLHSVVVCWPRNIITWYLPFTYYSNPVILVTVDWISRSSLAISFLVLVNHMWMWVCGCFASLLHGTLFLWAQLYHWMSNGTCIILQSIPSLMALATDPPLHSSVHPD